MSDGQEGLSRAARRWFPVRAEQRTAVGLGDCARGPVAAFKETVG